MIFILAIWRSRKDHQIHLRHYRSICTTSMGFSTYSTQNCHFKIPPTAFLSKPPNIMFTNNSAYTVFSLSAGTTHWFNNNNCVGSIAHNIVREPNPLSLYYELLVRYMAGKILCVFVCSYMSCVHVCVYHSNTKNYSKFSYIDIATLRSFSQSLTEYCRFNASLFRIMLYPILTCSCTCRTWHYSWL